MPRHDEEIILPTNTSLDGNDPPEISTNDDELANTLAEELKISSQKEENSKELRKDE